MEQHGITNETKKQRRIWIILLICSLLLYFLLSLYEIKIRFGQIDANSVAFLIGRLVGYIILTLVITLIVVFIKRVFSKKRNLQFIKMLSIIASLQTVFVVASALSSLGTSIKYLQKRYELYQVGNYDEALLNYDKALELEPSNSEVYFNKGLVYKWQNNHNEALKLYKKAIVFNPKYSDAYWEAGYSLNQLGKYDDAVIYFDKGISLNADNRFIKQDAAQAYLNRAYYYLDLKDEKTAIDSLKKAIEYDSALEERIKNNKRLKTLMIR